MEFQFKGEEVGEYGDSEAGSGVVQVWVGVGMGIHKASRRAKMGMCK